MKPQYSDFEIVGENYILVAEDEHIETKKTLSKKIKELPYISIIILSIIVIGSVFSSFIMTHEPTYMDLASSNLAPNKTFFIWNRLNG